MNFGVGLRRDGFNIFALGSRGLGKRTVLLRILKEAASRQPAPSDWCYVHNFEHPHRPVWLELRAGTGRELRRDMTVLAEDFRVAIPAGLEEILRAAHAAATLAVRHFVIHPGPEKGDFAEHERLRRMENAARVLTRASDRCREVGIHLVLENMLPHLFAGRVQDLLWILGAMKTVEVGVCIDTGHAHLAGELPTIAQKLSSHLWMVHASDNRGEFDDHLAPGDGQIDWEEFLRHLAEIQFAGTIILEIASSGASTLQAAQRGRRHLNAVARRLHEPKPQLLTSGPGEA